MDWWKIVAAIAFGGMLIMIFPAMMRALKDSPEGNLSDWMSALIPIALVGGFIALLVAML